jgi:hypothetical protein
MPTLKKEISWRRSLPLTRPGAYRSEATSTNSRLSSPVRGHALMDPDYEIEILREAGADLTNP